MYKILDNLATHGLAYNDTYYISKERVSEEELLTFYEATDEDGKKWLIIDTRVLSDHELNNLQDYLALIDTSSRLLDQDHRILICCGAGISRSNAIALGILIKHFKMEFYAALELIQRKVPICNIDPLHIMALKEIFNLVVENSTYGL